MKKFALYLLLISATLLVGVCLAGSSGSNSMAAPGYIAAGKDIVDTVSATGNFKTLATALQTTGLIESLKGMGPFTVFAPTDAAFEKIPKDQLNALMANKAKLTILLGYHIAPVEILSNGFKNGMTVRTVQGERLNITMANGGVMVENAKIVQADIKCSNGVIHAIDTVLIPKGKIKHS